MPTRSFLTPKAGAMQLLKRKPALHFDGSSKVHWQTWRRKFAAALIRLMGPRPEPTPLRVRRIERVKLDGYTRDKIEFNPDAFSTVSAYVLTPDGIRPSERRPALLCAHGHGEGKSEMFEKKSPYR